MWSSRGWLRCNDWICASSTQVYYTHMCAFFHRSFASLSYVLDYISYCTWMMPKCSHAAGYMNVSSCIEMLGGWTPLAEHFILVSCSNCKPARFNVDILYYVLCAAKPTPSLILLCVGHVDTVGQQMPGNRWILNFDPQLPGNQCWTPCMTQPPKNRKVIHSQCWIVKLIQSAHEQFVQCFANEFRNKYIQRSEFQRKNSEFNLVKSWVGC